MLASFLSLAFITAPGPVPLGGIYCDEILAVIAEYQEETGAFTEEQMERYASNCESWEENDEDL